MVGGALARASDFRVGLGVSGDVIVSGSCACPSYLWMSHVLTQFTIEPSISIELVIVTAISYLPCSPFEKIKSFFFLAHMSAA